MTRVQKVLVTGSLGYIGSVLTPYLSKYGFECRGYDTGFFKDCLLYKPEDSSTIFADMRHFKVEYLDGIDAVIHLAAISNDPVGGLSPETVYMPTRVYTKALASLCKAKGIKFIFPSSCSVYGISQQELLNETSLTNPQTGYSKNKLDIEQDLASLADDSFAPIALRLATVFGPSPRLRFDLVINMLTAMAVIKKQIILNSDGMAWRPHVYIDDVCKAFRCALESTNVHGLSVINVGRDDNNMQIRDVAETIRAHVRESAVVFMNTQSSDTDTASLVKDRKIPVSGRDIRTYQVSFKHIRSVFSDFTCDWSIEKGIEALLDVFRKIALTEDHFNDYHFYRLQRLERLVSDGYLTDDLLWKRKSESRD